MIMRCHIGAGNQTGSSVRATSALDIWDLSPAPWTARLKSLVSPSCLRTHMHIVWFIPLGSVLDPEGLHSFLHTSHSTWPRLTWCKCTYWHWILSQKSFIQVYSSCFLVKRERKVFSATQERLSCQTGLAHTVAWISSSIISWEFLCCLNKIRLSICVDIDITISKGVGGGEKRNGCQQCLWITWRFFKKKFIL